MTIITTVAGLLAAYTGRTLKDKLVQITGADLSEAALRGADLSGAYLHKADLSKANLREADLSEADLSKANLSEANLREADLSKANLSEANLSEANLSEANLSEANLSGANLSGANLLKTHGIFSAFTLHMSSRTDSLTGYLDTNEAGEIILILEAGCWNGTPEEFRERIADEKSEAEGKQYLAAAAFIETCFNDDMANKKYKYLKTWDEDHKQGEQTT